MKKTYQCAHCHAVIEESEIAPECCGKPMVAKLEMCRDGHDSEMTRTENPDEPCDDGRQG